MTPQAETKPDSLHSIYSRIQALNEELNKAKFRHCGDEALWDSSASLQGVERDVRRLLETK